MKIISDHAGWSLDEDAILLQKYFRTWLQENPYSPPTRLFNPLYFVSRDALKKTFYRYRCIVSPLAFDFYHGNPNDPSFSYLHKLFRKRNILSPSSPTIVRVPTKRLYNLYQENFPFLIPFLIPIPVDTTTFFPRSASVRNNIRASIGAPPSSFVIGSFQKDGIGWEDGLQPKRIKGPDLFLSALQRLKQRSSRQLFVLLTGPSRGYVKRGLEKLQIPYFHKYTSTPVELAPYYSALDVYLVSSRDEGGPKAVLESMASGIPLVSTRVGMAQDLIQNNINALISDPHPEPISKCLSYVETSSNSSMIQNGLLTSHKYCIASNQARWNMLFDRLYHST